jgi:hypothetical protein
LSEEEGKSSSTLFIARTHLLSDEEEGGSSVEDEDEEEEEDEEHIQAHENGEVNSHHESAHHSSTHQENEGVEPIAATHSEDAAPGYAPPGANSNIAIGESGYATEKKGEVRSLRCP